MEKLNDRERAAVANLVRDKLRELDHLPFTNITVKFYQGILDKLEPKE
jgi:osmotically-inducible protein OsmY